jgi:uncharacterized RmlC-like cupin family protein
MEVSKIALEPSYKKDNGLWALDTQNVLPPDTFQPIQQSVIALPAQRIAGNHKHKRKEALFGIGESAYFLWQDKTGIVREEQMNPGDTLYLFVIPPDIPHAVVNRSADKPVVLYEYFDDIYRGVERVNLLGT